MKTTMLNYCITILLKVSFSRKLFLKEYRKAQKMLADHESIELRRWIRNYRQQTAKS
jgi:hypothetical protein